MQSRSNKEIFLRNDKNHINKQYKQSNYEAWLTLSLYIFYSIWWWFFAYVICNGNVLTYSYILGFPSWFFFSCLIGFPLLCCILWLIIHFFFKEVPLDTPNQNYDLNDIDSQIQSEHHPELL